MLENALIQLLISVISAGLTARGISDVSLEQAYQPQAQGTTSGSAIYCFQSSNHAYGWVKRESKLNESAQMENHVTQWYETTFQISAQVPQDPSVPSALTSADLAATVAFILQDQPALDAFAAQSVGVLRITEIIKPYYINGQYRFQAAPFFNFILTHDSTSVSPAPVVESIKAGIYRV
jgi:hypothetical protein